MRMQGPCGFLTGDSEDIAGFIVKNYVNARKVVEVGVGAYPWVADYVKQGLPNTKVVVVDIEPAHVAHVRKICPSLEAIIDDLWEPRLEVYQNAALVYSLRPPPEIVPQVLRLARRINADIIIYPLFSDEAGYDYPNKEGWRLTRHGHANFYWLRLRE